MWKVREIEQRIKDFIEAEIGEVEIEEQDGKFYVCGCLKAHYGSYEEPPYCEVELEGVGDTEKEALIDALIIVVKQMKSDTEAFKKSVIGLFENTDRGD